MKTKVKIIKFPRWLIIIIIIMVIPILIWEIFYFTNKLIVRPLWVNQLNEGTEMAKKRIITKITKEAIVGKEFVITGNNLSMDKKDVENTRNGSIEIQGYRDSGIWGSFGQVSSVKWTDNEIIFIVPDNLQTDRNYTIVVSMPVYGQIGNWIVKTSVSNEFYLLPDFLWYDVKAGDSLFKIARTQLGAEGRYLEILKLNKVLYPELKPETKLGVGMRLRIPIK
jgi:hypothetical protein